MGCFTTALEQSTAALCAQATWSREGDDEIGSLREVIAGRRTASCETVG